MFMTDDVPEITRLLKLAKQSGDGVGPATRVVLLADTASQLLAGALSGYARHAGFALELLEGEFDQIEMAVFDPASKLHQFRPDTVILYLAAENLAVKFGNRSVVERGSLADEF